jgi:hypothetical protein
MLIRVRCELARNRGASGIFYPVQVDIEAETFEECDRKFRAQYETGGPSPVYQVIQSDYSTSGGMTNGLN